MAKHALLTLPKMLKITKKLFNETHISYHRHNAKTLVSTAPPFARTIVPGKG